MHSLGGMLVIMNVAVMPLRRALKRWALACVCVMLLIGVLATGVVPVTASAAVAIAAAAASQDSPCVEQDHHAAHTAALREDVDSACALACCHGAMVLSQQALSPALTPVPRRAGQAPQDLLPTGRTVTPETPPPIVC